MSELEKSINEVNSWARSYNAAIAEFMEASSEKIKSLTAELAAATQSEWTPITCVEQVEGLAAGFYELKLQDSRLRGQLIRCDIATKETDRWVNLTYDGSTEPLNSDDIESVYQSYKLISAFKEAAPAIPEHEEKVYGKWTAEAWATSFDTVEGELARDLLEALAKGEK